MDRRERGYFRRFCGLHGDVEKRPPRYLVLFDLIVKMKAYDEDILREELGKTGKFKPAQIPNIKSYLYKMLLKSLNLYHQESSEMAKLRFRIRSIQTLLEKSLHKQAAIMLRAAKQTARKFEFTPLLADLLELEKELIAVGTYNKHTRARFEGHLAEIATVQDHARDEHFLNQLAYELRIRTMRGQHKQQMDAEPWAEEIRAALEAYSLPANAPVRIQLLYYFIQCRLELRKRYPDMAPFERRLQLFEEHPEFARARPTDHLGALTAIMSAYSRNGLFWFGQAAFERIGRITARAKSFQLDHLARSQMTVLAMANSQLRFREAIEIAKGIEPGVFHMQDIGYVRMVLYQYLHAGTAHFCVGNFKSALEWFRRILNHPMVSRFSIYTRTKIYFTLTHIELENRDFLDYEYRSLQHHVRDIKASLPDFDRILVRELGGIIKAFGTDSEAAVLLQAQAKVPPEPHAYGYQGLMFDWLAAKSLNMSVEGYLYHRGDLPKAWEEMERARKIALGRIPDSRF